MRPPSDLGKGDVGLERHETPNERHDRNLAELLQELRVASIGVQVLFGFLLSLPFTVRFVKLDGAQRGIYIATLLLSALSTALLCGPVAFHRLVIHRHEKSRLLRAANVMALLGLTAVGLAISGAITLVMSFVEGPSWAEVALAATVGVFAGLWFVLPIAARQRGRGAETL